MKKTIIFLLFMIFPLFAHGDTIIVPPPIDETVRKIQQEGTNVSPAPPTTKASAVIVHPDPLVRGGLIKLHTDGSSGTVFGWSVPANLPESHYYVTDDNRIMIISPASPGTYYIGFVASDGAAVSIDTITIVIGDGVSPPPKPEPTPEPGPMDDSLEQLIDRRAPQSERTASEAAALAMVYANVADLIRDKQIVNGAGAWGIIRTGSERELMAFDGKKSLDAWRSALDDVYDFIRSNLTGRDDMSGLEKYFRESEAGFRRLTRSVDVQSPNCDTGQCKTISIPTNTPAGSRTHWQKAPSRPLRRLIAP